MPETGSGRVGLVSSDSFWSETGIVCKPSHVDGVIECLVGERSERSRSVQDHLGVLFAANK